MVYEKHDVDKVDPESETGEHKGSKIRNNEGKILALTNKIGKEKRFVERLKEEQNTDVKWKTIIQKMDGLQMTDYRGKEYCKHAGLLFLKKQEARNKWVLCIPEIEVHNVLKEYHDEHLHPGINRMYNMLKNLMVWTGMYRDVKKYVRSCHACQVNKCKQYTFSGPWQSIIPGEVGDVVAVDLRDR